MIFPKKDIILNIMLIILQDLVIKDDLKTPKYTKKCKNKSCCVIIKV